MEWLKQPWVEIATLGKGSSARVFVAKLAPPISSSSSSSAFDRTSQSPRSAVTCVPSPGSTMDSSLVVVKSISKSTKHAKTLIANEAQVLEHLWAYSDEFILRFRKVMQDDGAYYIVTDHRRGYVTLEEHIASSPPLSEFLGTDTAFRKLGQLRALTSNLFLGLQRIHSAGGTHRGPLKNT